jgi:hypothetical protein
MNLESAKIVINHIALNVMVLWKMIVKSVIQPKFTIN